MPGLDKPVHTRPNRGLGQPITALLHCPMCKTGGTYDPYEQDEWEREQPAGPPRLRIIGGYRANGVRLECPQCRLRFTVPISGKTGIAGVLARCAAGEVDVVELRTRPITAVDVAVAARIEERERGREDSQSTIDLRMDAAVIDHMLKRFNRANERSRSGGTHTGSANPPRPA